MKNNFTFLLDVVFNVVYSVIMNVKKGQYEHQATDRKEERTN